VQLRGLPYRATVADIRNFLGVHAQSLKDDNAIQLVLNRDGRPSGFARVQFNSATAAAAVRQELHLRVMELGSEKGAGNAGNPGGDRYVEVFLYSERPNKLRFKKTATSDTLQQGSGAEIEEDLEALGITKDEVIQQCREHMKAPGQGRLLLSMLGVALSHGARLYLKKTDQGLKHFLSQYPHEFTVDGAKGREMITYLPAVMEAGGMMMMASSASPPPATEAQKKGGQGRRSEEHRGGPATGNIKDLQPNYYPSSAAAAAAAAAAYSEDVYVPQSPQGRGVGGMDGLIDTPKGFGQVTPSDWGTPGTPQHFPTWNPAGANLAGGHRGVEHQHAHRGDAAGGPAADAAAYSLPDAAGDMGAAYNNWSAWAMPPTTYWPAPSAAPTPWAPSGWGSDTGAGGLHAGLGGGGAGSAGGLGGPPPPMADPAFAAAVFGMTAPGSMLQGMPDFISAATAHLQQQQQQQPQPPAPMPGAGAVPPQQTPVASMAMNAAVAAAAAHSTPAAQQPQSAPPEPLYVSDFGVPPCSVRLRGLPFTAQEQDVLAFFAKHDVVEHIAEGRDAVKMVPKASGKPSGQAIVQMLSRADAMEVVQALNGQYMGTRYIEVFHDNGAELAAAAQAAAAQAVAQASTASAPHGPIASPTRPDSSVASSCATPSNEAGDTGGSGSKALALAALAGAPHSGMPSMPGAPPMQQQPIGPMFTMPPDVEAEGQEQEGAWEALFGFLKSDRSDGPPQQPMGSRVDATL